MKIHKIIFLLEVCPENLFTIDDKTNFDKGLEIRKYYMGFN